MALHDEFEKSGNWLFQRRSFLPFLLLPLVLTAFSSSDGLEKIFGERAETCWSVFCVLVSCAGMTLRAMTVGWVPEGTSGRNTKGQLAETLNTADIYSVVRHPLYFANFLIALGFSLYLQVWWFVVIFALIFWLYYERIMFAEEQFLARKFGAAYSEWARKTPAFLPDFSKWRRSGRPFSFKMVFKREYTTLMGTVCGFVGLEYFEEAILENEWKLSLAGTALVVSVLCLYFVLRVLRKKTSIFTIVPHKSS